MWILFACLYVNGAVMTCDQAVQVYVNEDACMAAFTRFVAPLDIKAVADAGQDMDIHCVRLPTVAGVRPDVDRSRG